MKTLLIALALSTLMLSGCGMFRSHHAWKQAKQENPLQIPPGLDRPATTDALTIPPPPAGSTQATPAQGAKPAAKPAQTLAPGSTRMHLSDDVDTAFKRVGLALQRGDLGSVTSQDAATHTYQLSVDTRPALGESQGFLQKHFSNLQKNPGDEKASGGSALNRSNGSVTVTLKVSPASGGGSTVAASGDPQQAAHVISVLSGRLGG